MGVNDLNRFDLPKLDWSHPEQALTSVHRYVVNHAHDAENWYTEKRRPKRRGGRALRISAIVLVGVAALIPILSEVATDEGRPVIPAAWASVLLILAATLVALDHYFGFSTGWTRFMAADLKISRLRREFEFRWQELEAPAGGSGGDAMQRLKLARDFVARIDRVVEEETSIWSNEFQAALESAVKELGQHKPAA